MSQAERNPTTSDTSRSIPVPHHLKDTTKISLHLDDIIEFGGPEAQFPGGIDSLQRYVNQYFECYEVVKNDSLSSKIILHILVDKHGKTTYLESIHQGEKYHSTCHQNFVIHMPKWIPACNQKDCYPQQVSIPITLLSADE